MRPTLQHSLISLLAIGMMSTSVLAADRMEKLPAELEKVKLTEKLSAPVAIDQVFLDELGKKIRLADLLHGTTPVILSFNYSNCPMLCSLQLSALVDTMREMDWSIGKDFEIITISLDPYETKEHAAETKARYLESYDRKGSSAGWHFLTGNTEAIQTVADSVGFGFQYHAGRKEYLHPAVLTLVSPQGNVSGYVPGIEFDKIKLRDMLIVAGTNEISPEITAFILSCYHYEARTGRGAIVSKIMTYGGLVFVIGFVLAMAVFRTKRSQVVDVHQIGSTGDHV